MKYNMKDFKLLDQLVPCISLQDNVICKNEPRKRLVNQLIGQGMLIMDGKPRLNHLAESLANEKLKTKCKVKYKTSVQTSCESKIRCDRK